MVANAEEHRTIEPLFSSDLDAEAMAKFWQTFNASYERCFGVSFNDMLKEVFSENGSDARVTD